MDVTSSGNLEPRPSLPPKPCVPQKPTPPPRQTHGGIMDKVKTFSTRNDEGTTAVTITEGAASVALFGGHHGSGQQQIGNHR